MTVSPLRQPTSRPLRVFGPVVAVAPPVIAVADFAEARAAFLHPPAARIARPLPPAELPARPPADPAPLDPAACAADPRLIERLGATFCLREGILPIRQVGGATLVGQSRPGAILRHASHMADRFGLVLPATLPPGAVEAEVGRLSGAALARRAETSVAPRESCRSWNGTALLPRAALLAAILAVLAAAGPAGLLGLACAWAVLTLAASTLLRIAALTATLRPPPPEPPPPVLAHLPVVSVIVALHRESGIAARLIRRLGRLDYPRDRLEILLAVEADDRATRAALEQAGLPGWMRIVVVPDGFPRTKPRALNYALNHCRGTIIGVYDAEDAPEADQIARVVARFAARGPGVACLQGQLDYYNPRVNWLSRCFTIEYAAWFRVILPGIARLGLPVPLGGTTLFFRRDTLEELGGWDAHNVTEDADLGIRLARHGYRTELIDTVTGEEANCRLVPWVKQRSRWIKGFMLTWIIHMREPGLLWRQLGPCGFAGFQVMFLGSVSQALLAPVQWSFWLLVLDLPHPLAPYLPPGVLTALVGLFLLSEAAGIAVGLVGLARTRHRLSRLWVPTLHFYHPLAALAAWKAAWELLTRPFWWDKTAHGLFDTSAAQTLPAGGPPSVPD